MKTILRIFMSALCALSTIACYAYDFYVANADGIRIYYDLLSSTECAVTYYSNSASTNKLAYEGDIVIPNKIEYSGKTLSVTKIGDSAFYGCSNLTSIKIPGSVKVIGNYKSSYGNVFNGCNNLKKAEFESIEAFIDTQFSLYNSNPIYYARHLYIDGQEITELNIPEGTETIQPALLAGAEYVTKLTIPSSVKFIEDQAFYECSGLTSISLPKNLQYINRQAFYGCVNLKRVDYADIESLCKIAYGGGDSDVSSHPMAYAEDLYVGGNYILKSATIIQYTIKGRFMSR